MQTPIFLLHGLGPEKIISMTLYPLEIYLNHQGYQNTYRLSYPVNHVELEEAIENIENQMIELANKESDEIILIGQSMGGVVANNLHKKGWRIKKAIYIGSPLHGAKLLNQLEDILPEKLTNMLNKKAYDVLKKKERESEPPHPYHTISMGWFYTEFDGCVYKEEAMLDEKHHTHLAWADHRTIFANPRLWNFVKSLLE